MREQLRLDGRIVKATSFVAVAMAFATMACTSGSGSGDMGAPVVQKRAADTISSVTSAPVSGSAVWSQAALGYGLVTGLQSVGTASLSGTTFTLTSNGVGPLTVDNEINTGGDGIEYVFKSVVGDFELVARLTSARIDNGPSGASIAAGVMVREQLVDPTTKLPFNPMKLDSNSVMGAGYYSSYPGFGPAGHRCTAPYISYQTTARELLGDGVTRAYVSPPAMASTVSVPAVAETPIVDATWLRLQRVGNDFAFWHARNTSNGPGPWVPVEPSGGPFVPVSSAPVLVGFFVGGSAESTGTNTATFDNVSINQPVPSNFATTWVGASGAALSTGVVSSGMTGMAVAPNGRVLKYNINSEQGYGIEAIDGTSTNGAFYKLDPYFSSSVYGVQGNGVATDGNYWYVASTSPAPCSVKKVPVPCSFTLERHDFNTFAIIDTLTALPQAPSPAASRKISALVARDGKVYIGDADYNCIRVVKVPPPPQPMEEDHLIQLISSGNPPGPMALDHSGRLWLARVPYATSIYNGEFGPLDPIECYDTNLPGGTACSGAPTFSVQNPTALAVDQNPSNSAQANPATERLLVAAMGGTFIGVNSYPTSPTQPLMFQVLGNVYDSTGLPGFMNVTGAARLYNPSALGVDGSGNLYVGSSAPDVQIQKFSAVQGANGTWSQVPSWSVYGLGDQPGSFDPNTNGNDFYTVLGHYRFDPTKHRPGSEWTPLSVTWNPYQYATSGTEWRVPSGSPDNNSAPRIRSFQGTQGSVRYIYETLNQWDLKISQFNGEIASGYGWLRRCYTKAPSDPPPTDPACLSSCPQSSYCIETWNDTQHQHYAVASEVTSLGTVPGGNTNLRVSVDKLGSIWLGFQTSGTTPAIWQLAPTVAPNGDISYVNKTVYPAAAPFNDIPSPELAPQPFYDPAADTLYVFSSRGSPPTYEHACGDVGLDHQPQVVARYRDWSTHALVGSPSTATPIQPDYPPNPLNLPDPRQDPNAAGTAPNFAGPDAQDFIGPSFDEAACGCGDWKYTSFDVADGIFFAGEQGGMVFAYKGTTGQQLQRFFAGPEVSGVQGNSDHDSVRAVKLQSGEYLINNLDTFDVARNLVFRWTPPAFSPQDLAPLAWYRADSITNVSSGGALAAWADSSQNARNLTQTVTSAQPTYVANGWNGNKPVVRFSGSNSLSMSSWASIPPAGPETPFTVLAVVKPTGTNFSNLAGATIASWASSPSSGIGVGFVHQGATNLEPSMSRAVSISSMQTFNDTAPVLSQPLVLAYRFDGAGRMKITVNGMTQRSGAMAPLSAINGPFTFVVGEGTTAVSSFFTGDIAELVIVGGDVQNEDVANFRAYAQAKWGGL